MQSTHTLKALASSLVANAAIALALGFSMSPAAYAGDIDEGYPTFPDPPVMQPLCPEQAEAPPAATPQYGQPGRETQLPTRTTQGVDSRTFWLSQHPAHPLSATAVVALEADRR